VTSKITQVVAPKVVRLNQNETETVGSSVTASYLPVLPEPPFDL
jgi:hypothetical protein